MVEVLADREGFPVLVRQGKLMAATFHHPELDPRIYDRQRSRVHTSVVWIW
jgi:glutamine amidotransferase PdxT